MVQHALQLPFPDRIQHQSVLLAQFVLFLGVSESAFSGFAGVRFGPFSNTAAANEHLRLQQKLPFAGFTLHVIDGVVMLDVGIEAKNHKRVLELGIV